MQAAAGDLPTIPGIENVGLVEARRPKRSTDILVVLRRGAAEFRIQIDALLPGIRCDKRQTLPEALLAFHRQPLVPRCTDHLEVAESAGDREGTARVGIARTRWRI